MLIVRVYYIQNFFICLDGDKLIANLLQHKFFFIQNHGEDCVILSVSGFVQSVMEFELFGVACHAFFGIS